MSDELERLPGEDDIETQPYKLTETEGEQTFVPVAEEALIGGGDSQSTPIEAAAETTHDAPFAPERNFEEITLAELIGQFFRRPDQTIDLLVTVAKTPKHAAVEHAVSASVPSVSELVASAPAAPATEVTARPTLNRQAVQIALYIIAVGVAWVGTRTMAGSAGFARMEDVELAQGIPFTIAAFFIWLVGEFVGSLPQPAQPKIIQEEIFDERKEHTGAIVVPHPSRVFFVVLGVLFSLIALRGTENNQFTLIGVVGWIGSIILWVAALAPAAWGEAFVSGQWLRSIESTLRNFRWRNPTFLALLAIILIGAYFRLSDLAGVPGEMTSDHVEKILDSNRVLHGVTQVFFPNNGGREPAQMYFMALLSQVPGLGMNFTTLKLLTALEGIITLPLLWWMGREIVGRENRQLGNITGLALAGLVAVSSWHEILSRMGLRIVLTVLVTALLLMYLARALRDNRRGDFIKAGLVLGFGLYTYQAVRMLPVVVLVGIGLALLFAKGWRARWQYIINLAVLVLVSFVVFVPLFGFSLQYPSDFWRRTAGRLLGDDIIQTTDEAGNLIERQATFEERMTAFQTNLPVLMDNIRNALLMFNWKGDVLWFSNAPNAPFLDPLTGAFFIVGLAALVGRFVRPLRFWGLVAVVILFIALPLVTGLIGRLPFIDAARLALLASLVFGGGIVVLLLISARRDPMLALIPLALFIMLLPSALSIAYTVENPSATRTSGTIPMAYLIAALPLGILAHRALQLPKRVGMTLAVVLVGGVIGIAYTANANTFFNLYRTSYLISSLPYTEMGRVLRGFAESEGGFGNAFMVGYPYWWDHRAIGLEAGRTDWPNGIDTTTVAIPDFLREAYECRAGDYQLNPERDMVFMVAPADVGTQELLQEWFPSGYGEIRQTYQFADDYYFYRVPRLGTEAFLAFLEQYSTQDRC